MDADEQGRKPKTLSDFAGAVARELTDPMSIVQGRLELLLELGLSDADLVQRHLEVALDHARRVSAILRNLRLVGRVPAQATESTPISRVVDEALQLVGPRRERVVVDVGTDPHVGAEEAMLARVVAFVVRHALDASGQSPIHLRVRQGPRSVSMRIGPPGRVRAEPVPESRDWMLDAAILAGLGGRLVVRPVGVSLQFEIDLPLPAAPEPRRRSARSR